MPRLLLFLLAVLVACSGPPPGSRDAPPATTSAAVAAGLPDSARHVLRWLPGTRPVAGWTMVGIPQSFGPDNLWESIDGGAETFVTFGFQELVRMSGRHRDLGVDATIEVYRMADALGAFGIYAQERNPAATFIQLGAEGYTAPNVVNFWNGSYYLKLTSMKTDDRIASALLDLAGAIDRGIGPASPVPAGVLALPGRDQVQHSARYLPRDILGQSYLANGFEAQYRVGGGKTCRLVTASFDSPAEAATAFGRYRAFVRSAAAGPRKPDAAIDDLFVGSDPFNGAIVATRAGATMAIVLGAPTPAALDLLSAFYERLPSP